MGEKRNPELVDALRQINRRLLGMESTTRMFEQRVAVVEKLMKSGEEKVARNTQEINDIRRALARMTADDREDVEQAREAEKRLNDLEAALGNLRRDVDGKAARMAVDQLMKYLHLIDPINHVTKAEVKEMIEELNAGK